MKEYQGMAITIYLAVAFYLLCSIDKYTRFTYSMISFNIAKKFLWGFWCVGQQNHKLNHALPFGGN